MGRVSLFGKKDWFRASVYTATAWGALSFLGGLLKVAQLGSWARDGLYLAVLAALGVAVAFGFLAFRLGKR